MIDWNEIEMRGRTSGQFKTKCPACIDRRSNKKDRSLSVNLSKGLANCHYCNEFSIRDIDENKPEEKTYQLPEQNWRNYTNLSQKMVKWFEKKRGISQSTLINCGITEEEYYQPAIGKKVKNVVFNYFEFDKVVNKKYRSADKKFTQSANTKNIFYGVNDIIDSDEVYIVEGEMDKLAMYEVGIKNCISVPNGANDNDDVWENSKPFLKGVESFLIAVDCDVKGNELSERISHRLGKWRCKRISFKNKDANDDLIEGREVLLKSIENAKRYPVSGTFTAQDIYDDILALYRNGLPKTFYPKHYSFGNLKDVFSVMRGHLIVPTGIPSHGKSNFVEWYILNLINDYDLKASFFSPEHTPMALHQANFIQKFWGKPFFKGENRLIEDEIRIYSDWSNESLYLTSPEKGKTANWNWLFDKFKEQMYSYGVDIFVIDAFNKVLFNNEGNRLNQINDVLTRLTSFAQVNDVMIFLIAHPTKMKKNDQGIYDCPTLYDVSGSADFRNQTHDGFAIYRYFGDEEYTEFVNLKTKMSFQGEIGAKVQFEYHKPSGRYYARYNDPCLKPLYQMHENYENYHDSEPVQENLYTASTTEAFDEPVYQTTEDDEDDLPF